MCKHLLLFGHPEMASTGFQASLISRVQNDPRFEVRILSQEHREIGFIALEEQQSIESAKSVILHFPLFWYSMPAIVKEWIDTVFTLGWAFDQNGGLLKKLPFVCSVTTGAKLESYSSEGTNGHSLDTYLLHVQRTMSYAGMNYLGLVATDQIQPDAVELSADRQFEAICQKLGISAKA
jgi:glutathione-regulated potassium-efflux system ancillary protein KefG